MLSCQKVLRKVPPRFTLRSLSGFSGAAARRLHQGSTKVLPRLPKFRSLSGSLGPVHVELPKVSAQVS